MELIYSFKKYDLWLYLAWQDIVMRYRRTVVGPFWLVISTFISVILTALLGSLLFKVNLKEYFLYVACGMIAWSFISILLTESCTVFVVASGLIKNLYIPILTFCFRLFIRNIIVFFHNFIMVLCGILLVTGKIPMTIFYLIPSFVLLFINSIAISINFGFLATRLRDVTQAVTALLSILGFVTPIMWKTEMLSEKAYLADLNPFTHYVALIRDPMLGNSPRLDSITIVIVLTVVNCMIATHTYRKYKHKLVHWL